MRILFLTIALLIACVVSTSSAQTTTFHAGIARISVSAEEPFDTLVWYPTQAEEVPWQVGPFAIPARAFDEKVESLIVDSHEGANRIQDPHWCKGGQS